MADVATNEKSSDNSSKRNGLKSDFPKDSLESAMRIAMVIEESNAGQPYPPTDTAIALSVSPGSSAYRILLSSALKYGLTTGTYKSDYISLTSTGSTVAAPSSPEDRQKALLQAALTPTTLRAVYEYYRGKKLPEQQFFENTVVREFGIPKEHAGKLYNIFMSNLNMVGLLRKANTGLWVGAEAAPAPAGQPIPQTQDDMESPDDASGAMDDMSSTPPIPTAAPARDRIKNAIFLGHGKNKRPLDQLIKILDEYGIPHKEAIDEANAGRPIPTKVADTMRECGAAVLIFTADEKFFDVDGNELWKPSENIAHELGAASVLYGDRIIIFKEKGVTLASNFSSIGYIGFEKDKLSDKGIELFRELVSFKIVNITVGG